MTTREENLQIIKDYRKPLYQLTVEDFHQFPLASEYRGNIFFYSLFNGNIYLAISEDETKVIAKAITITEFKEQVKAYFQTQNNELK